MSRSSQERRREARQPASGPVRLLVEDPLQPRTVEGSLVDVSTHGFRARHGFSGLTSGQVVSFEHGARTGRARVAWTRVTGEGVESGFYILGE